MTSSADPPTITATRLSSTKPRNPVPLSDPPAPRPTDGAGVDGAALVVVAVGVVGVVVVTGDAVVAGVVVVVIGAVVVLATAVDGSSVVPAEVGPRVVVGNTVVVGCGVVVVTHRGSSGESVQLKVGVSAMTRSTHWWNGSVAFSASYRTVIVPPPKDTEYENGITASATPPPGATITAAGVMAIPWKERKTRSVTSFPPIRAQKSFL